MFACVTFQGRGFNTGVMLQDLKEMRNMKWNEIWKKVAQETLPEFGSTSLADQVRCTVYVGLKTY